MNDPNGNADLWVIVRLKDQAFGLPVTPVQEMMRIPKSVSLPRNADYVRGMITVRGRAIPLIDLRVRLGMPTLLEERNDLVAMLVEREEDHKNWLSELENSVKERRPFQLATDPHLCNFGRWYDSFHTDDLLLGSILKGFDSPHKAIHGIADRVVGEAAAGRYEEAFAIIERTRQEELALMINLFERAREVLADTLREIALVLQVLERPVAISVDAVDSVERLQGTDDHEVLEMLSQGHDHLLSSIGKRSKGEGLVVKLDLAHLAPDEALAEIFSQAEARPGAD